MTSAARRRSSRSKPKPSPNREIHQHPQRRDRPCHARAVRFAGPRSYHLAALLGLAAVPTLLVTARLGPAVARAARNVPWLTVETPAHVSVYQLLRARRVVFERGALVALEEALSDES